MKNEQKPKRTPLIIIIPFRAAVAMGDGGDGGFDAIVASRRDGAGEAMRASRDLPPGTLLVRVAPFVEMGSGTVVVTVAVPASAGIRFNRFATVEVVVAERAAALTIPHAALAVRGEEDRVLVCTDLKPGKQGTSAVVRQKTIVVGVRRAGRVEVKSGLEPGDLVVTAAPDGLRDGTQVRVVRQSDVAPVGSAAPVAKTGRRGKRGKGGRGGAK